MRRKTDAALLRKIATIRDLQRIAAEGRAQRAASTLREKGEIHTESEKQRTATEENWLRSMSALPIRMELAKAWSAALLQQEDVVRQAARECDRASTELDRRTADWRIATMRHETATDMAHKATKDRARRREETALQDVSDRHAQLWSAR